MQLGLNAFPCAKKVNEGRPDFDAHFCPRLKKSAIGCLVLRHRCIDDQKSDY
jgi:hypothetical protein